MHSRAPRPCFFIISRARSVRYLRSRSQLTRCCQSKPAMPKFAPMKSSPTGGGLAMTRTPASRSYPGTAGVSPAFPIPALRPKESGRDARGPRVGRGFHSFIGQVRETIFCRRHQNLPRRERRPVLQLASRRRSAGLPERMSAGEGVDLLARLRDSREVAKWRDVDAEEFGSGGLAGETDIRDRHLVAMAETTCFFHAEVDFERGQRLRMPMAAPCRACRLVDLKFVLQVLAHARHNERMRIAGHDLGEAAHPRPAARIFRQQRRIGPR